MARAACGVSVIQNCNYIAALHVSFTRCLAGQNLIQEALLVVMSGKPPPWDLVLPCSGHKNNPCLSREIVDKLHGVCGEDRNCVLSQSAAWVLAHKNNSMERSAIVLNGCFGEAKLVYPPNAEDKYLVGQKTILHQGEDCAKLNTHKCCPGPAAFGTPACYNGKHWAASGAGVVLLPGPNDPEVNFNRMKLQTQYLWHHGHGHLISPDCGNGNFHVPVHKY